MLPAKECNRCRETKPLDRFYADKSRPDGRLYHCIDCHKLYTGSDVALTRRRAHKKTPEAKRAAFERSLRRDYGLSFDEWSAMLVAQSGRCNVCSDTLDGRRYAQVDHCHATGRVRGIVCWTCNSALSWFKDDPELAFKLLHHLCDNTGEPVQWHLTNWLARLAA